MTAVLRAVGNSVTGYVVCGFYTPDYKGWFDNLCSSLDLYKQPHDFVVVPKVRGGWEVNTLAKAFHVLDALNRHPDRAIIWLDVDCTVRGDLSPLAILRGDICLPFAIKSRRGRAVNLRAHSGTMVIKPNELAKGFIKTWAEHSSQMPFGDDDEAALALTIAQCPDVAITNLDRKWFGTGGEQSRHIIVHDYASRETRKVHKIMRFIHRHLGTPALARGLMEWTRSATTALSLRRPRRSGSADRARFSDKWQTETLSLKEAACAERAGDTAITQELFRWLNGNQ